MHGIPADQLDCTACKRFLIPSRHQPLNSLSCGFSVNIASDADDIRMSLMTRWTKSNPRRNGYLVSETNASTFIPDAPKPERLTLGYSRSKLSRSGSSTNYVGPKTSSTNIELHRCESDRWLRTTCNISLPCAAKIQSTKCYPSKYTREHG